MMRTDHTSTSENKPHLSPAAIPTAGLGIQTKLVIGAANDLIEADADAMTDRVMRVPDTPRVHRKRGGGEEEGDRLQRKPLASQIAPFVQVKSSEGDTQVGDAIATRIESTCGGGHPLPEAPQSFMQSRLATDLSKSRAQKKLTISAPDDSFEREADAVADRVVQRQPEKLGSHPVSLFRDPADVHETAERGLDGPAQTIPHLDAIQLSFGRHGIGNVSAHVGGPAARAAQAMDALAYATGDGVAFRDQPDLRTAAHEAAHVVQQRSGVEFKGRVGEAGDRHERHADAVADLVVQGRSSEALLDAYARSSAPVRAVQRIYQPIVTRAPATAITIRTFIALVETEERKWPPAEQTQTALMITRLRKIFYGSEGWNHFLIPGGADISPKYNISQKETSRENLAIPFAADAELVRSRQVVSDASGRSPAIASHPEVRLEDGSFCDVGHVLAGLDAANRPDKAGFWGVATASDNKAAVTWTGDIGSVLAEILFKRFNSGTVSPADAQRIINKYASPQDMLGNIDAYVMADQYNISNTARKKVSELLRAYYLGATGTPDARAREHRYSRFCARTGLTGWNGSGFNNEAAWISRWAPEVGAAAALYVGVTTSGVLVLPERFIIMKGIQTSPSIRTLLRAFLDALKALVAAEPA